MREVTQEVRFGGRPTRAITMTVEHHLVYHSRHAVMWGFPGSIMKIIVRVRAGNDRKSGVGARGHVTLCASYNGVRSDSVHFYFRRGAPITTTSTTARRSTTRSRRCRRTGDGIGPPTQVTRGSALSNDILAAFVASFVPEG